MAIPSRVFVGLVVFGLIASLAIIPYTLLVLSGYEAGNSSPLLPENSEFTLGDKLVLVLGSLFSLALSVTAWRGLLRGARHDAEVRRQVAKEKTRRDDPPPGYQ